MASKLKGRQSEVFAKVAAINTLLDRYPVLTTLPAFAGGHLETKNGRIMRPY